jgi:hypothetical protein
MNSLRHLTIVLVNLCQALSALAILYDVVRWTHSNFTSMYHFRQLVVAGILFLVFSVIIAQEDLYRYYR